MLDPVARRQFVEALNKVRKEYPVTLIYITHHLEEVMDADRWFLFQEGKVAAAGTPAELELNSALLKECGLELPYYRQLAIQLRGHGIPVSAKLSAEELRGLLCIRLNHVSYSYLNGRRRKPPGGPWVLQDLSLTVESGEMLAIAGKSGEGKSTFLQLLKGFIDPSSGTILLDGTDPHLSRRPELFDRIGFIFQYPEHQLFAATVFDDIAFGLRHLKLSPDVQEEKVRKAMAAVELDYEAFKDRSPFELSGGEKARGNSGSRCAGARSADTG